MVARVLALTVCLVLSACIQRVDQSPEKQARADLIHDAIISNAGAYPAQHGRKVMYGCLKWPDGAGMPELLDLNYYYTELYFHYSASVMEEMRIGARGHCEAAKTAGNLDCICQQIDENGENTIAVPG